MDEATRQGIENLEKTGEASDLLTVPEGARDYVDLIGDENLDSFARPDSDSQQ
ncbi:hypothetical protein LJK88_10125 [Paenibacillus sp. P26]|nr:hypothetical protein LJK88_10125 [Paenibacillus sp. P26]UUZ89802.1 hypothetical protein LJK87_27540 [Paenibacillus sp. P25]